MTGAVNTSNIAKRFLETTPQSRNLSIPIFFASNCTSSNHSFSSHKSLGAVGLEVRNIVVTQAAVVVEDEEDPLAVKAEDGPLVVKAEDNPLVVEAEDGPFVVKAEEDPLVVEAEDGPLIVEAEDGPLVVEA